MMPIIISGKIGSGKSTFCDFFRRDNYTILSADIIAKELIRNNNEVKRKLLDAFGDIIMQNNQISFYEIRKLLCGSIKDKNIINSIVHPIFFKKLNNILTEVNKYKVVIEIPLIETCKYLKKNYILVFIKADEEIRKSRYLSREVTGDNTFEILNGYQMTTKLSEGISDHVVTNNGSIDELYVSYNKLCNDLNYE